MAAKERKKQNCSIYARQLQQGSRFNQPICWRSQKLMEEKLQSSEAKMFGTWMHNFYNFPKFSFGVRMQPGQAWPRYLLCHYLHVVFSCWFDLGKAYCNLRNDLNETNWKSFTFEMNSKSVISKMESYICEMKICNLRKEDSCCKLHQPEGWIGQFVTSVDNINYN